MMIFARLKYIIPKIFVPSRNKVKNKTVKLCHIQR